MARFIGYIIVFVAGFAACAFLLRLGAGGAARTGRDSYNLRPVSREPLPPVADAAAQIEPSVVSIDIEGLRADSDIGKHPRNEDEMEGSGSGIILSSDGYILTNNHVVAPMEAQKRGTIYITTDGGKEYSEVTLVGRDAQSDLAVLKIQGVRNLPQAEFGDSDALRVGDWAIAVGNPLGFSSTVTLGIISALNRKDFRAEGDTLARVIQTDAAINPGSSGGALTDIRGRVIGINTAIASSSGGNVGIGFAIPINDARRVAEQLIKKGKVDRPYLGIAFAGVDDVEPSALPPGVRLPPDHRGAVVLGGSGVTQDSPASRAGLRPYDVIRAINGSAISEVGSVRETVQARRVGDRVALQIWRSGKEFTAHVTLDAMPSDYGSPPPRHFIENPDAPLEGGR